MKLFGHGKRVTSSTTPATAVTEQKDASVSNEKTVIHSAAKVVESPDQKSEVATTEQSDQSTFDKLTADRNQLEKRVNQLNQQYGDARNQLRSQLLKEKDYLREQSRQVNRQFDTASKQRDAHFEQFSQLQTQRNRAGATLKQIAANIDHSKHELSDQQAVLVRLQGQASQIDKQRHDLSDQEEKLLSVLNSSDNLNDLMGSIETKRKRIQSVNQQDHELEQAESGVKEELTKQQAVVEKLSRSLDDQTKKAAANGDVKQQQQQLAVLDDKLKQQQAVLTADDQQLKALKAQKDTLAGQFDALADRMNVYFSSTKLIDNFQFDPKRHYVFYSNTLLPLSQLTDQHGLEVIDHLFDQDNAQYDVLTTDFNRELETIWQSYKQQGRLKHAGQVINPYLGFQHEIAAQEEQSDVTLPLDQAQEWKVDAGTAEQPETIRSASGKQTVMLQYRTDRSLESVKYLQNDKLFKMAIYDQHNILLATQYVDPHDAQHAASEIYYRPDHSVALEKVYFEDHVVVQTTDSGKTVERTFETENDYYAWWIKQQALTQGQDSLIIDTAVPYFETLLNDSDRQFELIPLISSTEDNDLIKRIVAEDSPVNNIIVSDEQVHQTVLKMLGRDMHIMVIDDSATHKSKTKPATIKTRIYIPKVS